MPLKRSPKTWKRRLICLQRESLQIFWGPDRLIDRLIDFKRIFNHRRLFNGLVHRAWTHFDWLRCLIQGSSGLCLVPVEGVLWASRDLPSRLWFFPEGLVYRLAPEAPICRGIPTGCVNYGREPAYHKTKGHTPYSRVRWALDKYQVWELHSLSIYIDILVVIFQEIFCTLSGPGSTDD